jgi:hypothetical protein
MQLLVFMSAADTISLLSLALALSTQYVFYHEQNQTIMAIICKVNNRTEVQELHSNHLIKADLFSIHSASAFSIWCWLVLSSLRYLAIYKVYFTKENVYLY